MVVIVVVVVASIADPIVVSTSNQSEASLKSNVSLNEILFRLNRCVDECNSEEITFHSVAWLRSC